MIDREVICGLLSEPPRENERINLQVEAELTSGGWSARGVTENLSVSGAFVRVRQPPEPGTELHVALRLPDGEPLAARALVRWRRCGAGVVSEGLGLQFLDLAESVAGRIRRLGYASSEKRPEVAGAGGEPQKAPLSRRLPSEVASRFAPLIRGLALRVAKRLPPHVSVEDLVGAGHLGLVDAYRRHDPARCDRFEPYALLRIRGAMVDELRSRDVLPRALRTFANKRAAATERLELRLRRAPTDAELAAELKTPLAAFRRTAARLGDGAGARLGPLPTADGSMAPRARSSLAPDEVAQKVEAKRAVLGALNALPPRSQRVIELYYADELTLRDIGAQLGLTESRVCQLHSEALQRIRALARISTPGLDPVLWTPRMARDELAGRCSWPRRRNEGTSRRSTRRRWWGCSARAARRPARSHVISI